MKRNILIFIIFFVPIIFTSCTKDHPEAITDLIIKNNTGHSIHLKIFLSKNPLEYQINKLDSTEIKNNGGKGGGFLFWPFETSDSVMVTFDNIHSIMHYKNENSGAIRSILNFDNWEKLKKQKYYYKYEYKFNKNDYNEALQTAHNNGS